MQIRAYADKDVRAIALLYFNTIHKVNIRDYTQAQVQAWAPAIESSAYWQQRFNDRQVVVAEDEGQLLGFAEYQDNGHIDCFYVHHQYQRRGVGRCLLQAAEKQLMEKNTRRLFAEVSLTAIAFFSRQGFVIKEERLSAYNQEQFRLSLMEKYL